MAPDKSGQRSLPVGETYRVQDVVLGLEVVVGWGWQAGRE
jgi:hypothetical protein